MSDPQFSEKIGPESKDMQPNRSLDASGNSIKVGRLDASGNTINKGRLDASGNGWDDVAHALATNSPHMGSDRLNH